MRTATLKNQILLVGGIDTSLPAEYIRDGASPNIQNFNINRKILTKRVGSTTFGASASEEILLGREFIREGTRYNVRIGLTGVDRYVSGAWSDITGTALTGSTDDPFDTAIPLLSGKEVLIITNGIDNVRKYTGTGNTADLGGSPPKAKYCQEYKGYLVLANITGGVDVAQRVQWSNGVDIEDWSGGNSGSQDLVEDGEPITGINIFGDYLCVHKKTSIYLASLVSSSSIFRFVRRATKAGAVCNNTIVNLASGEQVFLANDGIRVFNGVSAPLVESSVNEDIRDGLNLEYIHKSWAVDVTEKKEVWIACPIGDQTTPDTIYRFNYEDRTVVKDTRSNITAAWRFTQDSSLTWDDLTGTWDEWVGRWDDGALSAETPIVMLADNTGQTYYIDETVNDDNSVAVDAIFDTKDHQMDVLGQLGRWQFVEIWAKGGTLSVFYSTDSGQTWTETTGSPFTLTSAFPSDDSPLIAYFDAVGSKCRLRFRNNVSGETVSIKQYKLGVRPRELRR